MSETPLGFAAALITLILTHQVSTDQAYQTGKTKLLCLIENIKSSKDFDQKFHDDLIAAFDQVGLKIEFKLQRF